MVFSSILFLWVLLPVVLAVYYLPQFCGKAGSCLKFQNFILVVFSLFFYAWGEPRYILLMLLSVLINYSFGLLIERKQQKLLMLVICVAANLLILGYFKYFNFFVEIWNGLAGSTVQLSVRTAALPIGISFYTFQALSYVVDVYRKENRAQKNFLHMMLYISFFPQLIAGPIVKYHDIEQQIENRKTTLSGFSYGIKRFIMGLGKKVILANTFAEVVDLVFTDHPMNASRLLLWGTAVLYMLQIYFDFSGYSDMAVGLGRMFGFSFQENFLLPYTAVSIRDFWRKWHVSLSSWFREYVYIPLGGNRKGTLRTIFHLFVVWLLVGFWHGAAWNFVFWGLLIFVLLVIEKTITLRFLNGKNIFAWLLSHLYVMLYIPVSWIIFAITDFSELRVYLLKMFPFFSGAPTASLNDFWRLLNLYAPLLIASVIFSVSYPQKLFEKIRDKALGILILLVVFWYSVYLLAIGINNPFLYFRF